MIYIFFSLVGIVLVAALYLIVRIRIHRKDLKRQKKIFDDENSYS